MTRLKQGIASRKTYPGWSQQSCVIRRYERTRASVSWLTQNTTNVNLQTFSHNSAVTDAQTVWWADGINSEGQTSSSSSRLPHRLELHLFSLLTRENYFAQLSHTYPFYVPKMSKITDNSARQTAHDWPEFDLSVSKPVEGTGLQFCAIRPEAQNSPKAFNVYFFFSYSDVLLNLH